MTPTEFLRAVWPTEGIYALATPFTIPGTSARTYAHKTFNTIDEAAAYAERFKDRGDLYFCVHSLREHKVWNPAKTDRKTGELGAYEVRTQANTHSSRAFFYDLDVGDKAGKYPTQAAALAGLIAFCKATSLPKPMVTSSGGGLHVYWRLVTDVTSAEWRGYASKLRQLARHHGLLADPMRTTDTASVLRVAGSYNWKNPERLRAVNVLVEGAVSGTGEFMKLVDDALVRAGVTAKPVLSLFDTPMPETTLAPNVDDISGPLVSMEALVTACAQMQRIVRERNEITQPEWYYAINLTRFVENGDKMSERISAPHRVERVAEKLAILREKKIGPTSCAKMAEICGDEPCENCSFAGRVKSPLVAARFKDTAPAPTIQTLVGATVVTVEIPDPPAPYSRLKSGGVAIETTNKDGDDITMVIYPHDLYPLRRLVNEASEVEQQAWRVDLPREGAKDFTIDADALYDRKKLLVSLANHGIYPAHNNIQHMQDYMTAYIKRLQEMCDPDAQATHLGWDEDHTRFILPDKILMADGSAKAAQLSLGAQRSAAQVHKKGTLERQLELLKFFDHPDYIANQFFVLASLAAPIFYATGHYGVVINASGEPGASKSTSLYTASALWANPELYPLNGTRNGATMKGRNERLTTLANLPVAVDEITHMAPPEAIDLAMGVTQPGHRLRLDTNGVERAANGGEKSTIMLTTANSSLHSLLSQTNIGGTAASMRVLEIPFRLTSVHTKRQADDFIRELRQNYGHIGELFMAYVIRNRVAVEHRVTVVQREIDAAVDVRSGERFWSAAIAAILVAGEIAYDIGLLTYNVHAIRHWAVTRQFTHMRGVVADEYSTPLGTLADYMTEHQSDFLVVRKTSSASVLNLIHTPRGQLLGRYDVEDGVLWVLRKGFKDYCNKIGAPFITVLNELSLPQPTPSGGYVKVITNKNIKKVLGSGTDFAKVQAWCFAVNMAHPDVTGVPDLGVVTGNAGQHPNPGTADLRVVG